MNKAILIVDPQVDFINGSLRVKDGEKKMNELSQFLYEHDKDYSLKLITTDWHPYNHLSFKSNGGLWAMHCVQNSEGAAIYFPIIEAINKTTGFNVVLRKGNNPLKEEYSIFDNELSSKRILDLLSQYMLDELSICGLAGDICVTETIKSAIDKVGKDKIKVLTKFSPSLDGGKTLKELVKDNGLNSDL